MKQEDKRYEEWLSEIRNKQPVLDNPEELTAAILQRVVRTDSKKKRRKFIIGSWVLGIAAGFLLCLLINEVFFMPVSEEVNKKEEYCFRQSTLPSFPANWGEMSLSERHSYWSAYYIQHRQQKQKRILDIMNKTD
ncbi:hypothetical protein [Bacteroides sp.]